MTMLPEGAEPVADLELTTQQLSDSIVLVEVTGYIDVHTFERLDTLINELFEQGMYKLIIKMESVEHLSSSGAGVFVGAFETARMNDGGIVFLEPSRKIKEVFQLLGLSTVFPFAENLDVALAAFAGMS